MMKIFRRFVIGGTTGTREAAWFAFLIVFSLLGFAAYQEAMSQAMPELWALLTILCPVALAGVIGAGAHHKQVKASNPEYRDYAAATEAGEGFIGESPGDRAG